MLSTVTAKIKIIPDDKHLDFLNETLQAYKLGCNFISEYVFNTKSFNQAKVQSLNYEHLRNQIGLRSQMACSVVKTVLAKYLSAKTNGHPFSLVEFKKPEYDLVWNRDYSLNFEKKTFSVNTLSGRLKLPFEITSKEEYFDGTWSFGTAKLVNKYGKYFLHIPMTKDFPDFDFANVKQVVGVDLGINFLATTFDSNGKTSFFNGRQIKDKRAQFSKTRKELQETKTPSSRKRLKAIGSRENRWMSDVNHQISKALVEKYGVDTFFVLEDLTGVRNATERVKKQDRYVNVSWSFYQFRTMLEYKANLNKSKVILVDPKYTSQACPKCGHVESSNRNKEKHIFKCKTCGYTSNDDRIGAMNLQRKGIEYISEGLYL